MARAIFLNLMFFACTLGCSGQREAGGDFALPAGDVEAGQATFVKMRCYDCHNVPGVDMPPSEEPNQVLVQLGGEVSKVKSYADLVTSIINPSHRLAQGYTEMLVARDGESKMTNYNDVMTVAELTNLVAFLQQQYELSPPPNFEYPVYGY